MCSEMISRMLRPTWTPACPMCNEMISRLRPPARLRPTWVPAWPMCSEMSSRLLCSRAVATLNEPPTTSKVLEDISTLESSEMVMEPPATWMVLLSAKVRTASSLNCRLPPATEMELPPTLRVLESDSSMLPPVTCTCLPLCTSTTLSSRATADSPLTRISLLPARKGLTPAPSGAPFASVSPGILMYVRHAAEYCPWRIIESPRTTLWCPASLTAAPIVTGLISNRRASPPSVSIGGSRYCSAIIFAASVTIARARSMHRFSSSNSHSRAMLRSISFRRRPIEVLAAPRSYASSASASVRSSLRR
mmetsp:Transcript_42216/g.99052  ORF Transcript_42216/g.99052 Transcript_42216/m.99052 type:complete len:306 (-) Transcript_42216:877-1794(-)